MLASLRIGTLLSLAALVAVLVFTSYRGVDAREADGYRVLLRTLQREDNALSAELLRAAAGTVRHYDTLVRRIKARKQMVELLTEAPRYLGPRGRDELDRAIRGEPGEDGARLGGLVASLDVQSELVEAFKVHHSVLRHSVRFLPFAAKNLVQDATADHPDASVLTAELNALFTEVLLVQEFGTLTLNRHGEIQVQIDEIRERDVTFLPHEQQRAITLLARHAELIVDKKEQVDDAFEEIERVPVSNHIEQVRRVFERNHEAAAKQTVQLRYAAFVLSLATMFLGAAFIILRMKQAADELTIAKGKLETCLLYTSPSPRDGLLSRMPSSA